MTFRAALCLGLFSVVCLVFVGAVKSRPVGDEICRIVKQGECSCHCIQKRTTTWANIADLYKKLVIGTLASLELESECSKCEVECKRHISTNCLNGVCHKNGCECAACWEGRACNQPVNKYTPLFSQAPYQAQISVDADPGSVVVTTAATDKDSRKCTRTNTPCPCGEIVYSIVSGNEAGYFDIEKHSGKIRVAKNLDSEARFELGVSAGNEDGKHMLTKVSIDVIESRTRIRRSLDHHIIRRSARTPSPSGIIIVSPYVQNNTFYNYRDKIIFNMTASHNQSIGTANPTSELKFKCSSPFLSVIDKAFISHSGSSHTSKAVNNGELTFTVGTLLKADVFKVQFEVEVKPNIHPLANLYISCEATTSSYIIGPATSTPTLYAVFPKVTLSRLTSPADSLIEVDSELLYEMVIEMPPLNFSLFVEITSVINDFTFMGLRNVTIPQIGSNIGRGIDGNLNPTPKYHKSSHEIDFYDRATLDFKNLTVSDGSSSNSKIKIQWKVDFNDHPLVVNGSKYWSGAGLSSGSNMLHVAQQAIYAKKVQPAVGCTVSPKNNTISNRFSIDDIIVYDFECNHTNTSTANAKNFGLQIWSDYLQFESATYTVRPGGSSKVATKHNATSLTRITQDPFNSDQSISGSLTMKVSDSITPLVELYAYVRVSYQNEAGEDKMTTTHKAVKPAIAAVPVFSLNISNPMNCYKVGSIIKMDFKILMRKMNSPLRVEIISQVNASYPVISIASVSKPVIGSNIQDKDRLQETSIDCRSTVNESMNDRCTVDFGDVKSTTGLDNSPQNEIHIEFEVVVNDHPVVTNGSKFWQAVGVRGGSRMMWIGELAINVCMSPDPKPVLKLESTCYIAGTSQKCCDGKLKKNEEVQFNISLSHDNNKSEQYAGNVKIIHMLPYTVVFKEEVAKNPSNLVFKKGPPPELTIPEKLNFLEKLEFSYIATLDPTGIMPQGTTSKAVSLSEVSYIGHDVNKIFSKNVDVCCTFSTPADSSSVKPSLDSFALPEWYDQGFLVLKESQELFVCSDNAASSSCFYTPDGGTKWTAVNEQVGRVIGHVGNIVYGISRNKRAYMKQETRATDWFSITEQEWKSQTTNSPSKNLKTFTEANDIHTIEDTKDNGYKGDKIGVYFRQGAAGVWTKKAVWKCCGAI